MSRRREQHSGHTYTYHGTICTCTCIRMVEIHYVYIHVLVELNADEMCLKFLKSSVYCKFFWLNLFFLVRMLALSLIPEIIFPSEVVNNAKSMLFENSHADVDVEERSISGKQSEMMKVDVC